LALLTGVSGRTTMIVVGRITRVIGAKSRNES
jgi:hypothetical protein